MNPANSFIGETFEILYENNTFMVIPNEREGSSETETGEAGGEKETG